MNATTRPAIPRAGVWLLAVGVLLLVPVSCAGGGGGSGGGKKGPGPFRVLEVVPRPDLSNVSVATPVVVTFSRPVDPRCPRAPKFRRPESA